MKDVNEAGKLRELLLEGLKLTRKRLIATKKEKQLMIAVAQKGKVVFITPDKL